MASAAERFEAIKSTPEDLAKAQKTLERVLGPPGGTPRAETEAKKEEEEQSKPRQDESEPDKKPSEDQEPTGQTQLQGASGTGVEPKEGEEEEEEEDSGDDAIRKYEAEYGCEYITGDTFLDRMIAMPGGLNQDNYLSVLGSALAGSGLNFGQERRQEGEGEEGRGGGGGRR